MDPQAGDPRQLQESLDRLAELLQFRERFSEDPQGALERYDLRGVPQAAAEALAGLSPEELRVFAQVHRKLSDVAQGDEVSIFF